ncbi:hypothetical protein G647_06753 [Cladophialophora carrionii CBS 160.54]|uniref:DUF7918 domain-containing protein n=1 Tax=Cladophialophora carrionii CBS 160.54 TaxID=1279043 RepID=V9D9M9_9EURO|nr:uncharacterized protein G647_06753 [Cladophialophora carrionii CBS 160.54]ETI22677.1 hypothetical protein G647_06753 [Cladophialophora carrionii CBS 160.54]
MPILDKFEVQVFVAGTRAEEFDDDDEEGGTSRRSQEITKYIEAVSGAFFEFKFFAEANYRITYEQAISFTVFVDGERIIGTYMQGEDFQDATADGTRVEGSCSGRFSMESTGSKLYKFQFADLETRDLELDDDVSSFKEKYGDLGTLKVEVWRITLLDAWPARDYTRKDLETVPEKALKGRPLDVATRSVQAVLSTGFR